MKNVNRTFYACSICSQEPGFIARRYTPFGMASLGVPAGQIKVSFDVYDRQGNVNLAPNGEHTVLEADVS
jgi:hypothetical protein